MTAPTGTDPFGSLPPVDYFQYRGEGIALAISFMAVATISVVLRFAIRAQKKAPLGWDDWLILPSLASLYGFDSVIIWEASQGGFGISLEELRPPYTTVLGKTYYIAPIFSVPAISFAKLSILSLYYRVFATSTPFRRWVLVVGATVVMWMIACGLTTVLHCLPPKTLWDPQTPGHCTNFVLFFEIIEPINCLQDIVISVMPIFVIKRLQLDLKQKISIAIIFLLGNLVAVISLIRIVLIASPTAGPDAIYTSNKWLVAQLFVVILCANMLTYRPLLSLPQRLLVRLGWLRPPTTKQSTDLSEGGWPLRSAQYNAIGKAGGEHTSLTRSVVGRGSASEERQYPLNIIKVSRTLEVV